MRRRESPIPYRRRELGFFDFSDSSRDRAVTATQSSGAVRPALPHTKCAPGVEPMLEPPLPSNEAPRCAVVSIFQRAQLCRVGDYSSNLAGEFSLPPSCARFDSIPRSAFVSIEPGFESLADEP
jgi:hypothetical protein